MVGCDRPDQRDEGHQCDRREWGERHVIPAVDRDHIVRAEWHREPCAPMQERVGEIEEIAATGIEEAVTQPVDDRRQRRHGETDLHQWTDVYLWGRATRVSSGSPVARRRARSSTVAPSSGECTMPWHRAADLEGKVVRTTSSMVASATNGIVARWRGST